MKTKERILQESLAQFNAKGYTQVSVRNISDELKISPGNFTYHFKKKDDILFGIFNDLMDLLEKELDEIDISGNIVSAILNSTHRLYQHMFDYRFFFLEQIYFCQHYPEMKSRFVLSNQKRKLQFQHIFSQLRDLNLMFVETIVGYDNMLLDQIILQSNFWLLHEVNEGSELGELTIKKGVKGLYAILLPHLTLAGKSFFNKEFKKNEKVSVLRF